MAEDDKSHLTLRDVSEASGVSEMTVSRVLRNRGDVSAKTRARVLEAARRLGYVPNKIAGALASNRVNLVGVVIPSLSNFVFPDVLTEISRGLEETPLQPVFGTSHYDLEIEEKVIYEMLSWRPSGLIVAGLEHTDAARAMMRNCGVPVVEIMDVDGSPVDANVGISHRRAGRDMARTILAAGYRRIAYMGTVKAEDYRAAKRLEGFEQALAEAGIRFEMREHYAGGSDFRKGREMAEAVLARAPEVDFIYCSNDMIGAGAMLHCLEAGIDVPGRLGLAGFNGIDLLEGLPRRLTSMDACRAEIGAAAARIVAARALGEGDEPQRIEFAPRLIHGETLRSR
ncbi:LacI family transcriptional regulator [Maritimibacter sp. 55A14]|uniref:LacI family DNA-binding transcriptional regulator n=1 Tax=Maritimibacter sp. 55A14 TaxID=2174844 RepID=UPI000D6045FB|nr:LacI family DNA-binding transcriptional regulator [Maritimibacter sp. 55A14]PWE32621.1 LacI family transcriptional regulator [Maritimibacter sp. 55A14]